MNYKEYLNHLATKLKGMVELAPGCQPLRTDDYGWENHRYEAKHFRLAHVERYADGKIEVLHFTTFPHRWSPEPIFGFDVICTGKIVTGAYMDLSPIIATYPFDDGIDFRERKKIPEWATVFSDRFIMLNLIGAEEAQYFMKNILFPQIEA